MIKIYYRKTCTSSTKAIKWMKEHEQDMNLVKIAQITKEDLVFILSQTDKGLKEIIKQPKKYFQSL